MGQEQVNGSAPSIIVAHDSVHMRAKERQRRLNLLLMNVAAVVAWYLQRRILRNDVLWIASLPIILGFLNGITRVVIMLNQVAERRRHAPPNS